MPDLKDLGRQPTVEEVLDAIGVGRYQIFLLFVCGLSLMSVNIEALNMAFVLPMARCELGFTRAQQSFGNSIGFLGLILSSHMWGFLSDTWGRQRVLRTSLGLSLCLSVVSSFSVNLWMLLVFRFLTGFCISGIQSSAISYLSEFLAAASRPMFITLAAVFLPMATAYQPIMANFIMPCKWKFRLLGDFVFAPWRLYMLVNSGVILFTFPSMMLLPESPKFLMLMGRKTETIDVLSRIYAKNTGNPKKSFPVADLLSTDEVPLNLSSSRSALAVVRHMWNQTYPLFVPPHRNNMLLMLFTIFSMYFVGHGFYMWLPSILPKYLADRDDNTFCSTIHSTNLTQKRNLDLDMTRFLRSESVSNEDDPCGYKIDQGLYMAIFFMGCGFVTIYLVVAVNIRLLGHRLLFTLWLSMNSLAAILLLFTKIFELNLVLITTMGSSASCGSGVASVSSVLFPTQYRGMALCFIMMMFRFGALAGVSVIGVLVFNHCQTVITIFFALLIVSTLIVFCVLRNREATFWKCK